VRQLLASLLMAIACAAEAEVLIFEQAERAASPAWWGVFPEKDWTWAPVSLPHSLRRDPSISSYTWYRVRVHIDDEPMRGYSRSLYFPKMRLSQLRVYVNGQLVWNLTDFYSEGVSVSALQIPVPPSLLRAGENTIHLETHGDARWYQSLSRIYFGDTAALSKRAAMRSLLQDEIRYIIAAAFGAIGILSLWLWFRAGRDPVLFWYGVSGVTLLVATAAWYVAQWQSDPGWRLAMIFMRYHGYLVPFFILHLRLAGRRHVWLEAALWIVFIYALISLSELNPIAWLSWSLAFAALPALLTIPLLISRHLRTKPAVILLVVADYAATLLPLHDWAWRFGILDPDRPFLVYYAPAFVMLAAVAPIIERVKSARRAAEQDRLELERRVSAKTREMETSYQKLREVQREAALAEERRRIMADMHDGLGARLVALLSVAQSGKAKHGEISEGLAAALNELRLTVDSVQPVEGDVGVVLGNVRHRMRSVFERSGITLHWNVSELPRMEDLTPERILAIQRIFLEAFSNAIRHAEARTVSVFTMRVPGAIRIVIEDDGHGFDARAAHAGTGLNNLQLRAEQAGGTLQVESTPGKGTRLTLSLPLDTQAPPDPLPNTGQKTENYPVIGIPTPAPST